MNQGLSPKLASAFPNISPVPRPLVKNQIILDSYWISGFVEGEGCFFVCINKSSLSRLGLAVKLRFEVTQHIRDEQLLKNLEKYLACGRIELDSRGSVA